MPAGPALPPPDERSRLLAVLSLPPPEAARRLLGQLLVRRRRGTDVVVRIVEAEAYLGRGDPAAHTFRGRTARTEPLWGGPGTVYVFLVYGLHHCLNLAVEREGVPGCVLVRAAEPLPGSGLGGDACRGPGRLCRALRLDARLSGAHVLDAACPLRLREGPPPRRVAVSARVGLRRAADRRLRFFDPDSPAVSGARRPCARAGPGPRGLR